MRRKGLIVTISIIAVLLLIFSAYQFETEPVNSPLVNQSGAYVILHSRTDSRPVNATVNALGSTERLIMGIDMGSHITGFSWRGIPLIVTKISQSTNFPADSMSYIIKGVTLYYDGSNQSLTVVGPISEGNYTMYLLTYSFNIFGNFSLVYFIHVAAIAESGIYHYTGDTYVFPISFDFSVSVVKA